MKGKIAKILGVGLALALVLSFSLVAAVPVAALSQPTVSIDDYTISKADADYTIIFTLGEELIAIGDTITITFPSDTIITPGSLAATILASPGWFSAAADTTEGWENSLTTPAHVTWSSDATARTVTATLPNATTTEIGQAATVQISITTGITNPSAVDDYTLTVKTSQETTAVESASYSITAPVLGGTVEVFNPSDVLMDTYSGATAVASAVTNYGSKDNYTIEVGPGTYTVSSTLTISGEGLTLKSTDGAAVTIIDASSCTDAIEVPDGTDDVTVEGFTIDGSLASGILIFYGTEGVTVQNNIFTDIADMGVMLVYDVDALPKVVVGATVSGNVIEDSNTGIDLQGAAKDCTISDNTITDCSGRGICFSGGTSTYKTQGNTITGNTITAGGDRGIYVKANDSATYFDDNMIEANTISGGEFRGIEINPNLNVTNLVITGNDITDNTGVGIIVGSWTAASDAIKFNNISGNTDYGIENTTSTDVDATHNWWGTSVASEIAAMVNDTGSGVTDYTPFLTDAVDAVFSATVLDTGVASLDAEDEVGVVVAAATTTTPNVISAAKYIANPGAPIEGSLAFYDVYVAVTTTPDDEVVLKFYADGIDENSVVYAWNELYDTWQECNLKGFSSWGGYIYVTIHLEANTDEPTTPTIEALAGLPFAISGVAAEFDPMVYDVDEDGEISKTEALNAIVDYFGGDITKDEALQVIALYFAS